MYASWTYRLRFIKKHLLMFLLAFGWLLIQTQVAVAQAILRGPLPLLLWGRRQRSAIAGFGSKNLLIR